MNPSKLRLSVPLKAFGTALALMACEPLNPLGTCGNPNPPCDQRAYSLTSRAGSYNRQPASTPGIVDYLPLSIFFREDRPVTLAFSSGGGGRAYALSCAGCEDTFRADSILFSTDLVTAGGDTLKAGFNFATDSLPAGIRGYSRNWLDIDSLSGFRDSVFEVRFYGKVNGAPRSDSLTLTVQNRDFLLPR
jgi:hypothetical protein